MSGSTVGSLCKRVEFEGVEGGEDSEAIIPNGKVSDLNSRLIGDLDV